MLPAILGFIQIVSAATSGAKALATLKKPPAGTKTVTANVAILIAWGIAAWGLDVPGDVVNAVAGIVLALANLVLRKLTKGPLPGED